jgi:hypothetical protein
MKCFILLFIAISTFTFAEALPLLDKPYPLPANFDGIITIYPDHENTAAKRQYWIVPSTARIFRNPLTNKLAFGLVHSGVSGYDPDGINVLLNVTVQPYVDPKTLQDAKKLISDADAKEGAQSFFNFINPSEETAQLLVGGQPIDWNFQTKSVVAGGSVDAGFPFQVRVKNSFDVRALTQAGSDDGSTIGALFTMKFPGIGDRIHVTVTAHFDQAYTHFKSVVSASGWFGLVKAQASAEWQTLQSQDWVNVKVLQGRKGQVDSLLSALILDKLMTALTERTGFFARQLKPNGLGNVQAPGGSGIWGWSLSAGGAFESVKETSDLIVDIDMQYTRDQEIAFGMSFPTGGPELKSYVKNLTDSDKPFPTSDDFKRIAAQNQQCMTNNIASLKKLKLDGTISPDQYDKYIDLSFNQGCHATYTLSPTEMSVIKGSSNLMQQMIFDVIKTKHENE